MRKLKAFMLFAIVLFIAACSSSNTPESVAESFSKALYTANFDGAKSYCTEDSKQAVDFVAAFATEKVADMKKADIKFLAKDVKLSEDGNSATIDAVIMGAIDLKDGEVQDSTNTKLHMVKQDEKWLVDFKLK
ncbi:MAG: DUF4878 domain-containing protein [Paludibacter sp.]|nr:DUF4878 domain-containing protein [Paludibacter sp.]